MGDTRYTCCFFFLVVVTVSMFLLCIPRQGNVSSVYVSAIRTLLGVHKSTNGIQDSTAENGPPIQKIAQIYLKDTNSTEQDSNFSESIICNTRPKLEDWSFSCFEKCPKSIQIVQYLRLEVDKICSNEEDENITKTYISENRSIFSVPYNSTCLRDLISTRCNSTYRVPNLVHYIWFTRHEIQYMHFLSFMSVMKKQAPCLILLHSDFLPYGLFWNYTLHLIDIIVHVRVSPPEKVFGITIEKVEHKADVHRLRCMHDYGGMYFDTDQILLKSLDPLRNYSFTQSFENKGINLANSLLISIPNSEFVSIWMNGYRTFNNSLWAYHSTILPYVLSIKYPELIHIESDAFIRPSYTRLYEVFNLNYNWIDNYALHIYGRYYERKHDLIDIRKLNTTIGSISRYILYNSKELCFIP